MSVLENIKPGGRARRLPEIDKVEQEVRARLPKEISYWDSRAFELKQEERAGKKTRLNWLRYRFLRPG